MNTVPVESAEDAENWSQWLSSPWTKGFAVLLFIIIAFYAEENYMGLVAWKKAQAEFAAAGESLDPKKLIPPSIPDETNFGVLSYFQLEMSTGYPEMQIQNDIARVSEIPMHAMPDLGAGKIPYLGDWDRGDAPNLPAIQKRFTEIAAGLPKERNAQPPNPLAVFSSLCPVLAQLRSANVTHPNCRYDQDYVTQPSFSRPLGAITAQIKIAQILAYEEKLALLEHQPQLAMDDLKVAWKLNMGLRREPILISGLVAMGVVAIQLGTVKQGLAEHAWNEQQLQYLDNDLGKIDFLSESQLCTRGEAVLFFIPTVDYMQGHPEFLLDPVRAVYFHHTPHNYSPMECGLILGCWLIPTGWFNEFKAAGAKFQLLGMIPMVDPAAHRVYPGKETHALEFMKEFGASGPLKNRIADLYPHTIESINRFAYAQVQVDQARIACRLERYRLTHGTYPDSLADLIPTYGSDLPRDVVGGAPYHYIINKDGTYKLYSVAWNQTDEGGDTSFHSGKGKMDALDWGWTNYPDNLPKP